MNAYNNLLNIQLNMKKYVITTVYNKWNWYETIETKADNVSEAIENITKYCKWLERTFHIEMIYSENI